MNDDLLTALNAERYGTGSWFTRKPWSRPAPSADAPDMDDSETTTARRRRELLADADHHTARTA